MARIEFPKQLRDLLKGSDLQSPIRQIADRLGVILTDNQMPFFPGYTGHGVDHIDAVLKSQAELIPEQVWQISKKDSNPRLLCDADATVIIGATLLHDIAMHLRPDGFLELVSESSRFQPLPWFCESHEGHYADISWHLLWGEYVREARRLSEGQLSEIVGQKEARAWKFEGLPEATGTWETNHKLVIGEFIRRHHARLAHEIAIYGFPGLHVGSGEDEFPAMAAEGHPLSRLADLIGLTARSHGTSLRVCKARLDASEIYAGNPRPMRTAVLYPMALLRVADYFQIDSERAPPILLQLRNPQSPASVQEWKKHKAVQNIGPSKSPRAKMITVSRDLRLSLYLQLRDLLAGLQTEMDHSTAVLDEAYGTRSDLGLQQLNLAIRRVDSNLQTPAFRNSLPYVPSRTGFSTDPNLLTLLVDPLYGKRPDVGVRELIQNATDAVAELKVWAETRGKSIESLDLPEQEGDVLVEFIKREDSTWFLRVQDRGIGMRSDTIEHFFLRAGASFRRSTEWAKEFLDETGKPRVARAGRFGVGAFAIFLLGPSFKMWSRHVDEGQSQGYKIEASETSQLIEIRRQQSLSVGTTIEVELSSESVQIFGLDEESLGKFARLENQVDWFCWDWPRVVKRVVHGNEFIPLHQEFVCPVHSTPPPPQWSVIRPGGFDAVFWSFEESQSLSCNGLKIEGRELRHRPEFHWPADKQLRSPRIAILDSGANLPLTTQRYALSQPTLPFVNELMRDVWLSFIAHALVCGPASQAEALANRHRHPLTIIGRRILNLRRDDLLGFYQPRWCATSECMVPMDNWLFTLLNCPSYIMCGIWNLGGKRNMNLSDEQLIEASFKRTDDKDTAYLWWGTAISRDYERNSSGRWSRYIRECVDRFNVIAFQESIIFPPTATIHIFASFDKKLFRDNSQEERRLVGSMTNRSLKWTEIPISSDNCVIFETEIGRGTQLLFKDTFLKSMESRIEHSEVRFVAEIGTSKVESPTTMLAKIWNECLEQKPIPFDSVARHALIEQGKKHSELAVHIGAWQEMKRTNSKWAKHSDME